MVVFGALLYGLFGLLWWTQVYQSPQRAFADMLQNNLKTASVTKTVDVASSSDGLKQQILMQTGETNAALWVVTAKNDANSVTTESIGTPKADYVRYTHIAAHDTKLGSSYKSLLNTWGKAGGADASLFERAFLDVGYAPIPPVGNLTAVQRQSIAEFMDTYPVFTPDYAAVKRVTVDGRRAYQYRVSVAQAPYVRLMQAFETDLGLSVLQDVSASQYQTLPPVELTITVDKLSHTMLKVQDKNSGYTATYKGYGLQRQIKVPSRTIPLDQLKQRLSKVER